VLKAASVEACSAPVSILMLTVIVVDGSVSVSELW
jgi:hypothetical protein